MIRAAAPSLTPDALPAVTVPGLRANGLSLASPSSVVSGRGCSSFATTTGPARPPGTSTGAISAAKKPVALPARSCERSANASWSLRAICSSSATFSAVSAIWSTPYCCFMRGLTKRQPMVVSWTSAVRENASLAFPITNGARVIDSTPPAIANSISPARIACAAAPTALRPEAHRRLSVTPGIVSGSPASRSAMRATLRLSSPAWLAQPRNTSSSRDQSALGWRAIKALIGTVARSSARTLASAPP